MSVMMDAESLRHGESCAAERLGRQFGAGAGERARREGPDLPGAGHAAWPRPGGIVLHIPGGPAGQQRQEDRKWSEDFTGNDLCGGVFEGAGRIVLPDEVGLQAAEALPYRRERAVVWGCGDCGLESPFTNIWPCAGFGLAAGQGSGSPRGWRSALPVPRVSVRPMVRRNWMPR